MRKFCKPIYSFSTIILMVRSVKSKPSKFPLDKETMSLDRNPIESNSLRQNYTIIFSARNKRIKYNIGRCGCCGHPILYTWGFGHDDKWDILILNVCVVLIILGNSIYFSVINGFLPANHTTQHHYTTVKSNFSFFL